MTSNEKEEPVKKSPAAEREAAKMAKKRAEEGRKMAQEGSNPFSIEGQPEEFEKRAVSLAQSKDANDAELSFLLFTLREGRGYIDKHYDNFQKYVEAEIGIGRAKANEMASTWEAFVFVGLPITVLGGEHRMNWNKFKLVRPLIKSGYLTEASIYEWLPWLASSGPEALRMSDIETRVKRLSGEPEEGDKPKDGFTKVKIGIPNDRFEAFCNYQDTIRTGMGVDDAGMQCLTAMEFLSSHIVGESVDAAKIGGLIGLKKAAEQMVPGITVVFISNNPEHNFDKLGVPPVHSVYQGFSDITGKKELTFCLAANADEAKIKLGTDSIREFPIVLTDSITNMDVHPEVQTASVSSEAVVTKPYADFDLISSEDKNKILGYMAKQLQAAKIINKDAYQTRLSEIRLEAKTDRQVANLVGNWLQDLCLEHGIDPRVPEDTESQG